MNIDLIVTVDVPPMRFVTGHSPDAPIEFDRMLHTPPRLVDQEPMTVVQLHSTGLSGYSIGQALRALADDVERHEDETRVVFRTREQVEREATS